MAKVGRPKGVKNKTHLDPKKLRTGMFGIRANEEEKQALVEIWRQETSDLVFYISFGSWARAKLMKATKKEGN